MDKGKDNDDTDKEVLGHWHTWNITNNTDIDKEVTVSYTTGRLAGRVVLVAVLYQGSGQLSSTSLQEWGATPYPPYSDSVPLYTPLQWIR